ncbi:hypothetical protein BDQ12DRAFT_730555 [Crucibulum laeve]|uniref:RING-type domain-containing protein n=1 Tax=Crucibulum laeve TaxID=68775 RepID=A0A5C3MGM1_9AGAR|nr:hypothetical protein BDQ12DRAFT_730555 [Crucibulum laeve]
MPVARAPSKQPRHGPLSSSPHRSHNPVDSDAAVFKPSGDDVSLPVKKRKDNVASRPKSKPKSAIPLGDVIEISSDDDDAAPSQASIIADLRRQLKKTKEENTRHKHAYEKAHRELTDTREENRVLQTSRRHEKGKLVDTTQLEDNINCEICTARMWSPHLLPDCGHAFCQSCLRDWFSTIQAQFMASNPHYDGNQPSPHSAHIQMLLSNPHTFHRPQIAQQIAQLLTAYQPPRPDYSCPTCREPVKTRPVEDFALKALVRTIASAAGENSPTKTSAASVSRRGNGRGPIGTSGPWDGFFPRI